jgi:hypothetical protein
MSTRESNFSIHDIAKSLARAYCKSLVIEAFSEQGLMETSLVNNKLSYFLLTEQEADGPKFSDSDANELASSIEKLKVGLNAVAGALGKAGDKFKGTQSQIAALSGDIPKITPGEISSLVFKGDAKKLKSQIEKANDSISTAGGSAASVINAVIMFSENINPVLEKIDAADKKEKTLGQLAEEYGDDPEIKFPNVATLKGAAQKAVKVPGWFKQAFQTGVDSAKEESGGFFAKVGTFFKSLFDKKEKGIDPKIFADEIINCTPAELEAVTADMNNVQEAFGKGITSSAQAATAAQAGVHYVASPEAAAERAEEGTPEAGEEGTPEAGEEGTPEDEPSGKKWKEISNEVLAAAEDKASIEIILKTLGDKTPFKDALKDKIIFEEGLTGHRFVCLSKMSSLLFEAVSFEDLVKLSGHEQLGDDVDKAKVFNNLGKALNSAVGEDVITGVPAGSEEAPAEEEVQAEEPAPADTEESEEAIEDSDAELRDAAQTAAAQSDSPLDAAIDAIRGWNAGLSKSSQQSLAVKNRLGDLSGGIKASLEASAGAISKQVADAIRAWRGEHEETLLRSKRFAKKNFDSLEKLIPQLAVAMLKKSNESKRYLTKSDIRRTTFKYLNKRFRNEMRSGILYEMLISDNDLIKKGDNLINDDLSDVNRWVQLAGLGDD